MLQIDVSSLYCSLFIQINSLFYIVTFITNTTGIWGINKEYSLQFSCSKVRYLNKILKYLQKWSILAGLCLTTWPRYKVKLIWQISSFPLSVFDKQRSDKNTRKDVVYVKKKDVSD